ncbi:MAG: energy-coupled thiamine transporter ThiT [Clostridia bacterium]|nr:energy-coupled thiamine transporter ThiT [Clostridia bacterium]
MKKTKTQRLILTAMMLAVATVIALLCQAIPFINAAFGGGFTVASMLPIVIIAYMFGTKWGLFCGLVYAVLQMLMGYSTVSAFFMPSSDSYMVFGHAILVILIDYIIAYTLLGTGGIFRHRLSKTPALCLGCVVALSLRYLAHVISGTIFFGTWAEWFFSEMGSFGESILGTFSGTSLSLVYSLFYNGMYMIPEIIVTTIVAAVIAHLPQIAICEVE